MHPADTPPRGREQGGVFWLSQKSRGPGEQGSLRLWSHRQGLSADWATRLRQPQRTLVSSPRLSGNNGSPDYRRLSLSLSLPHTHTPTQTKKPILTLALPWNQHVVAITKEIKASHLVCSLIISYSKR